MTTKTEVARRVDLSYELSRRDFLGLDTRDDAIEGAWERVRLALRDDIEVTAFTIGITDVLPARLVSIGVVFEMRCTRSEDAIDKANAICSKLTTHVGEDWNCLLHAVTHADS